MWKEKIGHLSQVFYESKEKNLGFIRSWQRLIESANKYNSKKELITAYEQAIYAILLQVHLRFVDEVSLVLKDKEFVADLTEIFFNKKTTMYGQSINWNSLNGSVQNAYIVGVQSILLELEKQEIKLSELLNSKGN